MERKQPFQTFFQKPLDKHIIRMYNKVTKKRQSYKLPKWGIVSRIVSENDVLSKPDRTGMSPFR